VTEFQGGDQPTQRWIDEVDHVNLAQPWQDFDEAVLFYTSVLGLDAASSTEFAGPWGLVRSQVMRTGDGRVRLPLNVAPPLRETELPQHVAFSCTNVVEVARRARARGLSFLPIPANYYDDLSARFGLDQQRIEELCALDLLYDRDGAGEFLHFYTPTIGGVFLEMVERRSGYEGYGAPNAPIRLAAQQGR
jgi:4-hydroxyphenylpyruvate dioxygenase